MKITYRMRLAKKYHKAYP